ncbi:MAG: amidohydrolase family protein [Pirellulaceae bacterium]|jgi:L-fuconolactonase|nr:amidohydrolase family protein [Pirellulaceae bacterium]
MLHRRDFHRAAAATLLAGSLPTAAHAQPQATATSQSRDFPIIDTHQHLWDLDRQRVAWLDHAAAVLRRSYRVDDYLAATRNWRVVKAIYMEVDVPPGDHDQEVELITDLCRQGDGPTVAAVIGGRPGEDGFPAYIRRHARNPYVKGVRQVLHGATPRGYCLQDQFVASLRLLGELGLSFDLCLRPAELADAVALVAQCPETQFIVDHCGNADPKAFLPAARRQDAPPSHDPDAWRRDMAALAGHPRVACKISGVIAQVGGLAAWSAEDLAPVVHFCLDTFGPDRVVFGSDWPVCRLGAELDAWLTALWELVRGRPESERQKLYHDNARRLYRV